MFNGRISNDTLKADYTFMSEGTESIRQIMFLLQGNTLTELYGEIEIAAGKSVFKESTPYQRSNIILKQSLCNTL
jgi:hypothetical protein